MNPPLPHESAKKEDLKSVASKHPALIWTCLQNHGGLISFSVEEAEEENAEEEVKVKEKTSGNILVVETDFERMSRRSSFRSKERRELTRYLGFILVKFGFTWL